MKDFSNTPAAAMRFNAEVTVETEASDGIFPVSMLARSSKPIEHWWWGKCVHDMDGYTLSKPIVPIDWCHTDDVLGFADKTTVGADGLTMSGGLVPFKEDDRATEILHKSKKRVPYEASINFAGDGTEIEYIPDGAFTQVNGFKFEGPGTVIRKWTLRGVAICPYGADQNTATSFAADNDKTFNVARRSAGEGLVMADEAKKEDDKLDDKAKGDSTKDTPPADEKKDDTKKDDVADEKKDELKSPAGAKAFTDAFGDRGAAFFCQGMSFEDAAGKFVGEQREQHKALLAAKDTEIADLKTQLEAAKVLSGNKPLPPRIEGDKETPALPKGAQNLSAGLQTFAASLARPPARSTR